MKLIYKILFSISIVIILASVFLIFFYGFKFSTDFKGGSIFNIEFKIVPDLEKIRNVLKQEGLENSVVSPSGEKGVVIKTADINEIKHQKIIESLKSDVGGLEEKSFESIGPVVGRELKNKSLKAIVIAILAITIYLTFMFRKLARVINPWSLGFATVMAGLHDLALPMGVFAYLGYARGIELDAAMIAVALTILGYSINDTVVIFDRIRENILSSSKKDFNEVVHLSIKQTLFRSLSTGITTLLSLIAIYFYGGETLKNFALALIIGVASGAYSSIALASPLLMILPKNRVG